jgi:ankyrin repeat protein
MRVKRSSNTAILAVFSVWIFSLTNTVLGEDAEPESNCEIIKEALHSENPERQILTLKNRKIDLNQLCIYGIGDHFESLTPLGYAVRELDLPAIKALIKSGANVNVPDEDGMTPIFRAGDRATVQFLLKAGANVNAETPDGWTPLMWQIISHYDELSRIVEVLISSGARVNQRNSDGTTALMFAAELGYSEVVRLLIKAKANLNIVDNNHNSALMRAARKGASETVKLLIAAKANPSLKNNSGESALDLAVESGNRETIAHIETALKKLSKSEVQKVPGQTTDNSKVSTRRVVRIQLQDGSSLAGEIIRENDIDLILLQNGNRLLIRKSDIQKQELAEN